MGYNGEANSLKSTPQPFVGLVDLLLCYLTTLGSAMTEKHKEIDGRLDLKVLPLTMCLYMVMLGILVTWISSWFFPVHLGKGWGFLGVVLVAAAHAVTKWCFRLFSEAKTNTNTTKPTLAIVSKGPYRFSRNPMYLCYVVSYAGLSLLANSVPMLALSPVFIFWITRWIICPEESYLEKHFGSQYLNYKNSKRRWL